MPSQIDVMKGAANYFWYKLLQARKRNASKDEIAAIEKVFQEFEKSNGYCGGFVPICLCAQLLQSQRGTASVSQLDDYNWFLGVTGTIADFKDIRRDDVNFEKLIEDEIADYEKYIEHFLSLLRFFQDPNSIVPHSQGQLDHIMEVTNLALPRREYSLAIFCTCANLAYILGKIAHEDRMICISSYGNVKVFSHATGMIRHADQYYYSDPNYSEDPDSFFGDDLGQLKTFQLDQKLLLAQEVFACNCLDENKPAVFGIRVFALPGIGSNPSPYPRQKKLLARYDSCTADLQFYFNLSPLHVAAMIGCLSSTTYFAGRYPSLCVTQTKGGDLPLHLAAANCNPEITEHLLKVDPPAQPVKEFPNSIFQFRLFPVHLAARSGDASSVECLYDGGVDMLPRDLFDRTPLYFAALHGWQEVFEQLLSCINDGDVARDAILKDVRVAIVLRKDAEQKLRDGLVQQSSIWQDRLEQDTKVIQFFKSRGWLSLHDVIADPELLDELLNSGAFDINAQDNKGRTAVMLSVINKQPTTFELLIEADNIDIGIADTDGNTTLHHAVMQNDLAAVETLLYVDADVLATNHAGDTPQNIAERNGFAEIIQKFRGLAPSQSM